MEEAGMAIVPSFGSLPLLSSEKGGGSHALESMQGCCSCKFLVRSVHRCLSTIIMCLSLCLSGQTSTCVPACGCESIQGRRECLLDRWSSSLDLVSIEG
eukprot:jgi/Botrbrau1/16878/Bobra.150_2s0096.1